MNLFVLNPDEHGGCILIRGLQGLPAEAEISGRGCNYRFFVSNTVAWPHELLIFAWIMERSDEFRV